MGPWHIGRCVALRPPPRDADACGVPHGARRQVLYGNHRDILQLVWISTLATQAMRVVLGYTRMYTYFEGVSPHDGRPAPPRPGHSRHHASPPGRAH